MKASHIQSRLGTIQIWIDALKKAVRMPNNFLIHCRTNNQWIGGSRDGCYYLYLEKCSTQEQGIPTMLAIPEIDLFFCSAGPVETVAGHVQLLPVSGELSSRWVEGYLAQLDLQRQGCYLLLIADSRKEGRMDAREQALAVIEALLMAAMEIPPAT